jgi:hypothetical protein
MVLFVSVVGCPIPDAWALGAVLNPGFHVQILLVVLLGFAAGKPCEAYQG